jgi:CheY-like chemotaxis protein
MTEIQACRLNQQSAVCYDRHGFKLSAAAKPSLHTRVSRCNTHLFAGYHVLLVQHRPVELQAVSGMLEAIGCCVTTVSESGKALLKLGQKTFALILSDLDMPQLNGFQLARHIRGYSPQTRILLMTACCQAEVVDYLKSDIVDGWLFKPFRLGELSNIMHSLFQP